MGKKGKSAARAIAPERNANEVNRMITILKEELDYHRQNAKETKFEYTFEIAKLPEIGAYDGGKIFKVERFDKTIIRASTIDNRLNELLTKPNIGRYVLITNMGRIEILGSLNNAQVEELHKLGVKKPLDNIVEDIFEGPTVEDIDIEDI
jgi:hypothetical protein